MWHGNDLPLAGGLSECLDRLNSLQAGQLDASLQHLLRPVSLLASQQQQLPNLAALPLSALVNLALLVKAAHHRFNTSQRAAVAEGLCQVAAAASCQATHAISEAEPGQLSILEVLGAELLATDAPQCHLSPQLTAVPPCPDFLYTPQPCFPWAPVLTDQAAAAEILKNQHQAAAARQQREQQLAKRQQQEQPEAGGGTKRGGEAAPDGAASPSKRKRQEAGAALDTTAAQPATQLPAADVEGAALEAAVSAVQAALRAAAAITSAAGGTGSGGTGAAPTISTQLREALDLLLSHAAAGSTAGSAALQAAGLHNIQEDSLLLLLLTEVVTAGSSFARCSAAASGLLLPRLQALQGPAPRDLAAGVEHVASCNPQAYITACLQPLLTQPGLNKHQAELLSGTLKAALPPQLLPDALAAACAPGLSGSTAGAGVAAGERLAGGMAAAGAEGVPGGGWNEHTVAVLQAVLNAKPVLPGPTVVLLADAFQGASSARGSELSASVKFAKLALTLVKQYPAEAAVAKQQLTAAAQAATSFMAKSLLAAVGKL